MGQQEDPLVPVQHSEYRKSHHRLGRGDNSAENLIRQHGGSGRPSKSDRKGKSHEQKGGVFLLSHIDDLLLSVATAVMTPSREFSVRKRQQSLPKRQ